MTSEQPSDAAAGMPVPVPVPVPHALGESVPLRELIGSLTSKASDAYSDLIDSLDSIARTQSQSESDRSRAATAAHSLIHSFVDTQLHQLSRLHASVSFMSTHGAALHRLSHALHSLQRSRRAIHRRLSCSTLPHRIRAAVSVSSSRCAHSHSRLEEQRLQTAAKMRHASSLQFVRRTRRAHDDSSRARYAETIECVTECLS